MPDEKTIQLHCPAKVNLALSVGAPLSNGMHPIASLMCTLSFGDVMTLSKADGDESHFDIQFGKLHPDDDTPMGIVDWPLEKDLACRALLAMQETVGRKLPVTAKIIKRIPAGAGLAGGSGNAAAMLIGLNQLYDLNLQTSTLAQLAGRLGSDVVFVVYAMQEQLSSAIVSGLGEKVTPINLHQTLDLVLIFPPFGCPTGAVYGAFDRKLDNPTKQADLPRVQKLSQKSCIKPTDPFNDLAIPACDVQTQLGILQKQITDVLDQPVHITGSGSTLYLLSKDSLSANTTAEKIRSHLGLKCIATQTL